MMITSYCQFSAMVLLDERTRMILYELYERKIRAQGCVALWDEKSQSRVIVRLFLGATKHLYMIV